MAARIATRDESFSRHWEAEILAAPPLIAPARQYVYPGAVEEVELGALQILLRTRPGAAPVMATFALGFAEPSLPFGIWNCPNPNQLCAVAGGYAYIVRADAPEEWLQVPYRPVVNVHTATEAGLLLFEGFHKLWALGPDGQAWETARLSWEGLRVARIVGENLEGYGWDLQTDREVPFAVDLKSGRHSGGVDPT